MQLDLGIKIRRKTTLRIIIRFNPRLHVPFLLHVVHPLVQDGAEEPGEVHRLVNAVLPRLQCVPAITHRIVTNAATPYVINRRNGVYSYAVNV